MNEKKTGIQSPALHHLPHSDWFICNCALEFQFQCVLLFCGFFVAFVTFFLQVCVPFFLEYSNSEALIFKKISIHFKLQFFLSFKQTNQPSINRLFIDIYPLAVHKRMHRLIGHLGRARLPRVELRLRH